MDIFPWWAVAAIVLSIVIVMTYLILSERRGPKNDRGEGGAEETDEPEDDG